MKRLLLLFLLALALMLSACTAESPEKPAATPDGNKFAAESSQTSGRTESTATESSQIESSQPAESSQTESSTSQESSKPEESSQSTESSVQEESSEQPSEESSEDPYVEPGTDEPILDASNYQEADWYINAQPGMQQFFDIAMMFYEDYHVSRMGLYYDLLEMTSEEDRDWIMEHVDLLNLDYYTNALICANEHVENWHYSPTDLRNVLTGNDKFTEDEADYAMANVDVDWYEEVLQEAAYYLETHETSPPYDMKTTMTGDNWLGNWPEDLVDYALAYYSDSFNDICLNEAAYYVETMSVSENFLLETLQAGGFNESQIDYAITYCGADWDKEAIDAANSYLNDFPECDHSDLYAELTLAYGFTDDQAAQACTVVGK